MVAGDLAILVGSQTSGYANGEIGLVVKVEKVGSTYVIFWILMKDGKEVPFWPEEVENFNESG